jgi:uncharacterized protein (DUF302 family)
MFFKKSFNDFKMCVDPIFLIEILHVQNATNIIQEQRELGFDIP